MDTTAASAEKFRSDDDDYEVVQRLGAGGMGTVYKARQKNLARFVAIKALNPEACGDADSIARLRREAAAAAMVTHPNVVKVHTFAVQAETSQPFIVMEYLEGNSLGALLDERGKMDESEAVPLFAKVLDGLKALHDAGLVHRDVKPHNIFVTTDGGVKLMDLGIVKTLDRTTQKLTQTGATIGSPTYMSPEQCSGEAVDGRADLYSLGCTLYRTLSGSDPFDADSPLELMLKHLHEPAPPLDGAVASPRIAAVVAKAMEKSAADRFANAEEFKDALLGEVPVVAPGRKRAKSSRWRNSRAPWMVAGLLALGLALVSGYQALKPEPSRVDAYIAKFKDMVRHRPAGHLPDWILVHIDIDIDKDSKFQGFEQLSQSEKNACCSQ